MTDLRDELQATLGQGYTVERELSGGGMSRVFVAEERALGRRIVVKVLPPELSGRLSEARFRREIHVVASLHHPYIVSLFSAGESSGLIYYAMPLVEGESLRARLQRERQLPVHDALRIALEVADALAYAHRHGVIHRDIKPENILLADGHAFVADFGVARAIAHAGGDTLTATGVTLGTPAYMSPEQAAADNELDHRTDVYSLGCVLFEMLAGAPPYSAATATALVAKILRDPVPSVEHERPTVPEAVDAIVSRALAKVPGDRFQSAEEMRAAIEHAAARGESRPARRPPARRMWVIASVTGIAVAAAAGALAWWPTRTSDPKWVLVADFAGPPTDATLGDVVRDIVSSVLEAYKPISTVPRDQLREARRAALIADSATLTVERARHLAYRTAVHTVIDGRIARVGQNYSIIVRAIDTESGEPIASVTSPATQEGLIATTHNLAASLARKVARKRDTLSAATRVVAVTPSLEAYRLFVAGTREADMNSEGNAIAPLKAAVALDSGFAAAWALLGEIYYQAGQLPAARDAYAHALTARGRLDRAQQLYLEGRIAREMDGDPASAVRLFGESLVEDPMNVEAYFDRAVALRRLGRYGDAVESFRAGFALSALGATDTWISTFSGTLAALGRAAEARSIAAKLRTDVGRLDASDNIAIAEADWIALERIETQVEHGTPSGFGLRAHAATAVASSYAARGRLTDALSALRRAAQDRLNSDSGEVELSRLLLRMAGGTLKNSGSAGPTDRPWLTRVASMETRNLLVTHGLWNALLGETEQAIEDTRRLEAVQFSPFATPRLINLVNGAVAARRNDWRALPALLGVAAWEGGTWNPPRTLTLARWLVADAYQHMAMRDSAAAYFELLANPTRMDPFEHHAAGFAATFAHVRAASLYTQLRRPELARPHWERVARDFANADPEVRPMLDEAKRALSASR